MNRALLFFLALLLLFAGSMTIFFTWKNLGSPATIGGNSAERLDPNRKLETFRLTDSRDQLFDSANLRGKVWVANFFFSRCPTVCLRLNQRVRELEGKFGPRGVEFVSISVDSEFDTPTVLSRYAQTLNANLNRWHFLTGQFDYVQKIATDVFQARVEGVQHDESLMLMDREHKLRGYFRFDDTFQLDALNQEIEKLLAPPSETIEASSTSNVSPEASVASLNNSPSSAEQK